MALAHPLRWIGEGTIQTMTNGRASGEVIQDERDEEQVDLGGDEEPEEIMDDEAEGEGDVEEEKIDDQEGLDLDIADDEGLGSPDEPDANVLDGGDREKSSDDRNNDAVEDTSPPAEADAPRESDKDEKEGSKVDDLLTHPPHGSEIFIGNIPRDITEEDLKLLCEQFGEIYNISINEKNKGENKGFVFLTFMTKESAQKAIETLNGSEFKGRMLRVSQSQTKNRLFLGNIPRNWNEKDLEKHVSEQGPGLQRIELLKDPVNSAVNRGYAFVDYYNNGCAENAMKNMKDSNFKLDGYLITVNWASSQRNVSESSKSRNAPEASKPIQVKSVHVRNLPDNVTEEQLRLLFEKHGEITKVVLPEQKPGYSKRSYGFVHFADHDSAIKAVEETEKYELDGRELVTSLARPIPDRKSSMENAYGFQRAGFFPNYHPQAGYGYGANMYGGFGVGYGATGGFTQPVIYGRGPTPEGMTMVPMILPDGRLGYVLQQHGNAPYRAEGSGSYRSGGSPPYRSDRTGSRGRQGSGSNSGSGSNRRYRPY